MLLAFVSEGVCVEGFNGVAKFNDAYGIEALDLSEASGCCLRCGMVFWVILQVIGIGEAIDNEHVRAEEGTFSIRDSRKDPLGNACCMGTWGKGARATDVEDGVKGTATVGVGGVVHDSSMNHESSFIMTIYDEFLHFGMGACPKDMGCVISRRVAYRADRATSIGADAGLCAVGQRAL